MKVCLSGCLGFKIKMMAWQITDEALCFLIFFNFGLFKKTIIHNVANKVRMCMFYVVLYDHCVCMTYVCAWLMCMSVNPDALYISLTSVCYALCGPTAIQWALYKYPCALCVVAVAKNHVSHQTLVLSVTVALAWRLVCVWPAIYATGFSTIIYNIIDTNLNSAMKTDNVLWMSGCVSLTLSSLSAENESTMIPNTMLRPTVVTMMKKDTSNNSLQPAMYNGGRISSSFWMSSGMIWIDI